MFSYSFMMTITKDVLSFETEKRVKLSEGEKITRSVEQN